MLILVSNDDGYQALGVRELIKFLAPYGEVVAVCPDGPRSGQSMALSFNRALRVTPRECNVEGASLYSVNGTPVDCVKIAQYTVLHGRKPDLVAAGINHGSNAGVNVLYSGTMGAVQEGCICGVPSIGFSLTDHNPDADFSECRKYVDLLVPRLLQHGLPDGVFLNVNVPHQVSPTLGARLTRECRGYWTEEIDTYTDPAGGKFYMLSGRFVNTEPEAIDTDDWALSHGYASVTAEQLNRSAGCLPEWLSGCIPTA